MWLYKSKKFTSEDIGKAFGFIYIMTDTSTGKMYIGQKQFWSKKTKQVNKKKKKVTVESDWKKYYSSSKYLQSVESDLIKREILYLCCSKGQMNYLETQLQMDLRVLENQDIWLNGILNLRTHHTHLKLDQLIDKDVDKLEELYKNYK